MHSLYSSGYSGSDRILMKNIFFIFKWILTVNDYPDEKTYYEEPDKIQMSIASNVSNRDSCLRWKIPKTFL